MTSKLSSRRGFVKKTALSSAAMMAGGVLPQFSAKSYARIVGANDMLRVSVMGVNNRGTALAKTFAQQDICDVIQICDVDNRATAKCLASLSDKQSRRVYGF